MEFIEIIKAIILGIIEGITEWLPVSSTGHMILVDEFLQLNMSPAFKEMFFVGKRFFLFHLKRNHLYKRV